MKKKCEEERTYIEMKRTFIQDGMMWVDAAKKAVKDKNWYEREYENYLKMGESYSKEAERCWEEVKRLDEELYKYVIEANICLIGAKVCLKGIELTKRMFGNKKTKSTSEGFGRDSGREKQGHLDGYN